MPVQPVLREAGSEDRLVLEQMLYEAIYVPTGSAPVDPSLIRTPELRRYYEGWMGPGDAGIIAQSSNNAIGAAWVRLFPLDAPGYGYIGPDVPELSMAVLRGCRGCGIGSMMLEKLLGLLSDRGLKRVSLSVDSRNPALRLYRRFGFQEFTVSGESMVMIRDLDIS